MTRVQRLYFDRSMTSDFQKATLQAVFQKGHQAAGSLFSTLHGKHDNLNSVQEQGRSKSLLFSQEMQPDDSIEKGFQVERLFNISISLSAAKPSLFFRVSVQSFFFFTRAWGVLILQVCSHSAQTSEDTI